jgi:hypothetical protein
MRKDGQNFNSPEFEGISGGAIDVFECTTRTKNGDCRCKPKCRRCGWGKHAGLHGAFAGQPPGSKPVDHAFMETTAFQSVRKDRNADIQRMHKEGVSLKDIAEKYYITVERVRQICKEQDNPAL